MGFELKTVDIVSSTHKAVPIKGLDNGSKSTIITTELKGFETPASSSVSDSGAASVHQLSVTAAEDGIAGSLGLGDDPAVIVGAACRLPGGIRNPSGLWDLLAAKKTTQGRVPAKRFNIDGFYNSNGSLAGVMNAEGGYFLQDDVRQFDNGFFGINNLEATFMDPQQRNLLEVTYECFESAGVSLDDMSGSNTAVYVGNFTVDYQTMMTRDPDYLHRYSATGSGTAIMANRISHAFNLTGPSFTLDTACSSSIYALHNAVMALHNGDCTGAVVAGANLITSIEQHLGTSKGGVLSPTSTCHTFDSSADGYGRAEGVNVVYVKKLSAAIEDGDSIRAVIRGTAINANGRTPGITQPSSALQEVVIRKAYANAGLRFQDTDYIECHGTGTAVGDPIEVEAIQRCFGARDPGTAPIRIGAVKTNVGHSEAASGLTAVLKVIMSFEKDKIPPTYGIAKLNPKLNLDGLQITTEVEDWPRRMKRASINSFGYGGANAHAILESLPSYLSQRHDDALQQLPITRPAPSADPSQLYVIPLSAKTKVSLEKTVEQMTKLVKDADSEKLRQLAYTLSDRRSQLNERAFLLARQGASQDELVAHYAGDVKAAGPALPFAFVFTGQGAQYAGMARELMACDPSFLATIRQLDSVLQSFQSPIKPPAWTLEQTLLDPAEDSKIHDVTRSQPICTAVQIGLVDLLERWGVRAQAGVVGHSSGEMAAAYAAGRLSAAQAISAAYLRGAAVGQLRTRGSMLAAGVTAEAAQQIIVEHGLSGQVTVACVNAPTSVTLSGAETAIEKLADVLSAQGKFARALQTGGRAYHSHMMAEIGQTYEDMLDTAFSSIIDAGDKVERQKSNQINMYSSVGHADDELRVLGESSQITAKYWRDNLESPVQFNAALTNLVSEAGEVHLIELGPHSALKGPIEQILKKTGVNFRYSATLLRNENANQCIKSLAGNLFLHQQSVGWAAVNNYSHSHPDSQALTPSLQLLDDLPSYPWDHSSSADLLWSEPRASVELRNRKYQRHELLGSAQLAGNGIDQSWRNLLRLSEVPWIRDHKLETTIVFPATGYLGMIMEAVMQMRDANSGLAFEFSNVNIGTALVLGDESSSADTETEIHTTVSPRKLSTANASAVWFDFSISSWDAGESTLHCSGSVRVSSDGHEGAGAVNVTDTESLEAWGMTKWYEKLADQGLRFGPQFQSLTSLHTDSSRVKSEALSTTKLMQRDGATGAVYTVHPLTLDACLQAAIMGGTAGNLGKLRACLPVFIGACRVLVPSSHADSNVVGSETKIHTRSRTTGFATRQIDATLRDVNGNVLVDMSAVRLTVYNGGGAKTVDDNAVVNADGVVDESRKRQPCLRVQWKPDILSFGRDAKDLEPVDDYLAEAKACQPADLQDHSSMSTILALLDLATFKNPRSQVLELGPGSDCPSKRWLGTLNDETIFPRCRSWTGGELNDEGELTCGDGHSGPFQTVVISALSASKSYWKKSASKLISLVSQDGGILITRKSKEAIDALAATAFSVVDVGSDVLLVLCETGVAKLSTKDIVIVTRTKTAPGSAIDKLTKALTTHLQTGADVGTVTSATLAQVASNPVDPSTIFISMLEMESEFLATMTESEMDQLRKISDVATDLLWLTGAGMLSDSPDPNLTLATGLSRALMLEQPSLRFTILDVGSAGQNSTPDLRRTCANITRALVACHDMDDKEFIQKDGLLYVSRFLPDRPFNSLFRRRLDATEPLSHKPLGDVGPARLGIKEVGQMDTLYFQEENEPETTPPAGFVDIRTKSVALNAKDIYTASGRVETRMGTAAIEFAGVVVAVGPDVTHLAPGDRAVVLAPNRFATVDRIPAWSAHKMEPNEDYTVMPTLPVAFGTALYALEDRAHLRAGETVLVHAGAGAFGTATIVMAQRMGAIVYATCGSKAKREWLTSELGVPPENIFSSRDSSFVADVQAATKGKGVDVVINSLVGDLMHSSWDCIADFGRFVEVGKRELVDAGRLDMRVFLRNCTFTAFDLTELFYHPDQFYRDIWINKTKQVLAMYRAGEIKPVPIKTFDVDSLAQAYRHFSTRDRVGKVVISLENDNSKIPVMPSNYCTVFSPEKTYLLAGCLGGLGRSVSRWMMARGARNFVFMGRSGCDKPEAAQLVARLRGAGATVQVVRGDVSRREDVRSLVQAGVSTGLAIGGVIQAAMGLHEALFCRMPNSAWHTGIQPKWAGSWNLHKELEGLDDALDFFLLTSSVSGSVGTATESNYCAANAFLNAFAHWRRSQGKPAVSIGYGMISEVGYLHENPEIEALLLRKGIQPLTEAEFLQVLDLALSGAETEVDGSYEIYHGSQDSASHILTGLEPLRMRELIRQGFEVDNGTTQDPRSGFLAAALDSEQGAQGGQNGLIDAAAAAPWFKEISTGSAAAALAAEADAPTLQEAVLRLARRRFSNLILMPADQIDDRRPLPQFGVDSMIAAEYRTWFWSTFKVDVPFLDMMSSKTSLETLSGFTQGKLVA